MLSRLFKRANKGFVQVQSNGLYPDVSPNADGWYDKTMFSEYEQLNGATVRIHIHNTTPKPEFNNTVIDGYYAVNGVNNAIIDWNGNVKLGWGGWSGNNLIWVQNAIFKIAYDCGDQQHFHIYGTGNYPGQFLNHAVTNDILAYNTSLPASDTHGWFTLNWGGNTNSPVGIVSDYNVNLSWTWSNGGWYGLICKQWDYTWTAGEVVIQILNPNPDPNGPVQTYLAAITAQRAAQAKWASGQLSKYICCAQSSGLSDAERGVCQYNGVPCATSTTPNAGCDVYMGSYCASNPSDPACACFNAAQAVKQLLAGTAAAGASIPVGCLADCVSASNPYITSLWLSAIQGGGCTAACQQFTTAVAAVPGASVTVSGNSQSCSVSQSTTPSPSPSPSPSSSNSETIAIGGLIAIVLVIIAAIVFWPKSKN